MKEMKGLDDGVLTHQDLLLTVVSSPLSSVLSSPQVTWTTPTEDTWRTERDTGDNCVLNSD